ncbi:MAG: HAD family hydrolase [Burkholderiaceae bacterium]
MNGCIDWGRIDLVVFDMDGTLYDAGRLRRAMLGQLLAAAWNERSAHTLRVLRAFRQVREALGSEECPQFMHLQYARTAARTGCDADTVRALVHQWMEQRPLPVLRACRQPHVNAVFEALRMVGKHAAVWSDYPARDKLRALDLRADLVACATDPDIARLKPDPRGLLALLERAGVPASRALMVGDRLDRDAQAARRAGVQALILARRTPAGVHGFRRYDDAVFAPLLEAVPAPVVA